MVIEVGEGLSPSAESGQAPCLWPGAYSLRDGHFIGRYAARGKVGVPFFVLRLIWSAAENLSSSSALLASFYEFCGIPSKHPP